MSPIITPPLVLSEFIVIPVTALVVNLAVVPMLIAAVDGLAPYADIVMLPAVVPVCPVIVTVFPIFIDEALFMSLRLI